MKGEKRDMEDITEYLHGLQVRKYMFYFKRPHKHEVLREDGYTGLYSNTLFAEGYQLQD